MIYKYTIPYLGEDKINGITWNHLAKQITYNVLDCIEWVFASKFTIGSQDYPEPGIVTITYTVEIATPLTDAQKTLLDELCSDANMWVPVEYVGRRFLDTMSPEWITERLRLAVPDKGLAYYGSHGEIGYTYQQPLTSTQRKAADAAFLSCFVTE